MAACEGSHFFIRYALVGGLLTDLCVVAVFTTDFHGFRHGISQKFLWRVWAFC